MFDKLKELRQMQEQAKQMQNTLSSERVTVSEMGVVLTMDGNMQITDVKVNEKLLNPETEDNRNSYELIDEKFQKKLKVFERKIKILKFCASNFILITIMMICLLVINKRIEN